MFIQQDLEDEPTLTETSLAAAVEVASVTPSPIAPAASTDTFAVVDAAAEEIVSFSPPYLLYAGIVLFMLTVPCAVYACGGPRLTLLRRLVRKRRARGYSRVSADDDVEK